MIINKKLIEKIRDDLRESLEEMGKINNVKIYFGSGTYTDKDATVKMHIELIGEDQENAKRKEFGEVAELYGLKEEDYNRQVKNEHGETYKIVGINTKKPKYPIQAIVLETKQHIGLTEEYAKKLLNS